MDVWRMDVWRIGGLVGGWVFVTGGLVGGWVFVGW